MDITVVVGDPKPASRTLDAAVLVAERLAGTVPKEVIDVVTLGPGLLAWGDPGVAAALATVTRSQVLLVASPTYKATYTGVLKLFLDQVPTDGLAGVVAVPLMLGAGPGRQLAPELLLKPVLVELGASCPTRALYLLDTAYGDEDALEPWLATATRQLKAATGEAA